MDFNHVASTYMGIGRGARRPWPSLDFENFSKNDCFLSFEWEKTKFATFDSPRKILEKSPSTPPEKSFRLPCPRRSPWSIFFNIDSLFEIQNVINLNICHAPGDNKSERFMHMYFGQLKHDALAFQTEFT